MIKKCTEELNRHFSKGGVQITNRNIKLLNLTLLTIWEMEIKITVRYHLTPVRMAIIKKTRDMLARVWRKGNRYVDRNVN